MTYEYLNTISGTVREVEQKISDSAYTHWSPKQRTYLVLSPAAARHFIEDLQPVRRLCSGGTGFQLQGRRWAKDGYT